MKRHPGDDSGKGEPGLGVELAPWCVWVPPRPAHIIVSHVRPQRRSHGDEVVHARTMRHSADTLELIREDAASVWQGSSDHSVADTLLCRGSRSCCVMSADLGNTRDAAMSDQFPLYEVPDGCRILVEVPGDATI